MKLRNKKTGEICNFVIYNLSSEKFEVFDTRDKENVFQYDSLADLCEEGEDYQDDYQDGKPWNPKSSEEYWNINDEGIQWKETIGSNSHMGSRSKILYAHVVDVNV